ncbi:MAG: GntR family transcriptional regulator [Sphingomonadales bacterium]|nr:GntR family transcriptional regulator [Sphingomonadales bacterium]
MNILTPERLDKNQDQKAAEFAAERIRQKILDGFLSPGQRLIEAELMTELDLGRSTIREAYLKLDSEGFVELRHQRGAVVKKMTRRDMAELFAIRERLEAMAAGLAAANIDKGDNRQRLERMKEVWAQDDVLNNELTHMEKNVPFHEAIITMGNNLRLARMLKPLQIPGYRIQYLKLLDRPFRELSAQEHTAIADAILAGNSDLAERLMRQHVQRSGELAQNIPGLD